MVIPHENASLVSLPCLVCGSKLKPFISTIWDDRYGAPGRFSISRCPRCGQMATLPRLQESDLPTLYSTYYPRAVIDFNSLENEAAQVLLPGAERFRWLSGTDNQGHYLARRGDSVLDVGCGSCLSLLELRYLGIEAFGIEADPNVKAVVERYNLNVHIGSIHDCPFPDRQFHLVTLNQVIEHVPDPLLLLQEVSRRLRPGGRIALSFPNVSSLQRRLSGRRWINWHVPYHQHHFNIHSFQRLALQAGFEIVMMRTITPNLWTVLQFRASLANPLEGQASMEWSNDPAPPQGRNSLIRRCWNRLAWHLRGVPYIALTAWNRTTDMLRLGDSILVVIKPVDSVRL